MSLSVSSSTDASTLLQRLLAAQQVNAISATGQDPPTDAASRAQTADGPSPPPPPKPDDAGASRLSTDTLSSLLGQQEQAPSFSDLASTLISSSDADASGGLSLSEIESALGGDGSGATAASAASSTDSLSQALANLDTNGDGQLSQDELATALQQNAPAGVPHRHRHHVGGAQTAAQATTTSSASTPVTALTATSESSAEAADAGSVLTIAA